MKYNVFVYTVVFFTYFGCKQCGGKPDSFVAAVDNQQGFTEQTGADVLNAKTSHQFDNWFHVSAQKENANGNYADKEPTYKNPSYSIDVNKFLTPILSKYVVDTTNFGRSGDNRKFPFITSAWPFAYPLPILRRLIQPNGRKLAIRIRAKVISNALPNVPTFATLLINPFTRLRSLYYSSNTKDKHENTETYKYANKDSNPGDNLEQNFPSPTYIFSRSVNNNLGTNNFYNLVKNLNITWPTNRPVFKHFVRHERNPCYSEYVNASGVYYYYDIVRVLKYLHGYSGWSDDPATNNKNKDLKENKIIYTTKYPEFVSKDTATNNKDDNAIQENQELNSSEIKRDHVVDSTTEPSYNKNVERPSANQEMANILKSEMKYFSKFKNINPTKQSQNIIDKQLNYDEIQKENVLQKSLINSSPFNNIFQSIKKQTQDPSNQLNDQNENSEQMKFGNVYANPDEGKDYLNHLRDDSFKTVPRFEDNPSLHRYIRPKAKVLMKTIDQLNTDFYSKIATIKKYIDEYYHLNRNQLDPVEKPDVTIGNVYANPDERD